jgi:hypothetical protein
MSDATQPSRDQRRIITVLEPQDEYPHRPDTASNYNESMYLNAFDLEREVGGWFRLGNRVNEGYAEMTVCLYLPGGRVAFMFGRPRITSNDAMDAGGLRIDVIQPFERLRLTYDGSVVVLDEPEQMSDPRTAFTENPRAACRVELEIEGISPMYGGRLVHEDGSEIEQDAEKSFAKAHYEQHIAARGWFSVGDERFEIDGLGLRDKSWGPRYWQALTWYRWIPMVFGRDLAMMISVVGRGDGSMESAHQSGMVLDGGTYSKIAACRIESEWDERLHQTTLRCWASADNGKEYEVTGEVLSLIPLRNRRATPDGEQLVTRITEAMTRFRCGERTGIGMSEYLDQVVDGRPVGPDVP